jgi:hypothetical protein
VSPKKKIRLGPSHTLHDGKGGLAGEGHWGDWLPPAERLFTASSATWDAFCNFYQNTARRLRHHPYGHALRRPIIRYTRALDSQDDDGSLLKLWTLAETLTNSGGSNYDVTIRRIASLFEARDLTRHVLEHLRFQRNDSAHGGEIRDDPRVLVYQVKGYIEALLDFHFGTGRMLESIEEAAQFMDLPVNLQTLKRRIFLHRKAIRFRS